MFDFVGKRYWYFLISALIIIPGIISLIVFGLKPGIEFSSGATMTFRFSQEVEQSELRQELTRLGHGDAIIQRTGEGDFFIRTRELAKEEKRDAEGSIIGPSEKEQIEEALRESFGSVTVLDFNTVSPIVAAEIGRNAAIAVVVAAIGILLYISWAFRRLPQPFRYGSCAIIALVHDVLVVLGIFSILGKLFDIEINAMFIIGVLTVIGYSVNNTIVVFDRIRENLGKSIGRNFEVTVNSSLIQTLGRSLNTALTTLFVLLALFLFGGATIHNFILVLMVGVVTGTYSSLLIASQFLVVWENKEWGRFFKWAPLATS